MDEPGKGLYGLGCMKKPLLRAGSWGSGWGQVGLAGLCATLVVGSLGGCAARAQAIATPRSTDARSATPNEIPKLLHEARDLQEQGLLAEATATLERALIQCRALQPAEPKTLALVLGDLSSALVRQQQVPRARTLLTEAFSLVTPGSFEDDQRLFQLHMVLAESYRYEAQPAGAVEHFERAVAAAARHEEQLAVEEIEALERLAKTLESLGQSADRARMRAYAIAMRTPGLQRRALSLVGQALFRREGLEVLRQRGGFARRRLRDSSTAVDIALEDALTFEPIASVVAPPTPQTRLEGHTVSNAARVVAAMRAGFRTCYQRALTETPNTQGSVKLHLKVGPGGEVLVVQALALSLPKSCVDCVMERAVGSQFDPPEGGSAVIAVPVTFVKQ